MIWLLLSCGKEIEEKAPGSAEDTAVEACGTGSGGLPEGLETIQYDDGVSAGSVEGNGFSIGDIALGEVPLHEAVSFQLDRPARIHGFSISYDQLPANETVSAGLYEDFGHNGFDFWQWDALWAGDRCVEELQTGEAATFVFPEPVEISHPGLVYVAHLRDGAGAASWMMDGTTTNADGSCGSWGDCRSSLNLPTHREGSLNGAGYYAYNGLSFAFQYDFLVQLHLEWLEEPPEGTFALIEDVDLGGRQAWGDYDNDGFEDVYTPGKLLRNEGEGAFSDVTDSSGISAMSLSSSGGIWGDYDNDGWLDLLAFAESGTGKDALLRNNGDGTFSDETSLAGLDDAQEENDCAGAGWTMSPTAGAAWWDLDGDGFLDIYLSNFICWTDFTFYSDNIYLNNGDGTFTDISGESGFSSYAFSGRGAGPADADLDGDVDLLVNNYTLHRNLFYRNNGDGTVSETGRSNGLAGENVQSYYGHTIGAAWGDLDNDGDLDAVHANLAHPRFFDFSDKTQVLLNDGAGDFDDIQGDWSGPAGAAGLRYQETHSVPVLADYDQDGSLDLSISAVYEGRPTDFYWGNGDGTFQLDTFGSGIGKTNGWGSSAADIDNDGDMDLAVSEHLYENKLSGGGHWLQIRMVGNQGSNQAGIGTTIWLHAGERVWTRHINGGSGQGEQDSIIAHFGIGDAEQIDRIEFRFPMRDLVSLEGPFEVDQRLWIYEDSAVWAGWHP
jgi:hypothetical protein